jgi:hypothetical protein
MSNKLEDLKHLLDEYGQEVTQTPTIVEITGAACLGAVPTLPGVYWIETTMPVEKMRIAISEVLGRDRVIRKKTPKGTTRIDQNGDDFYVVYSGTEENINRRLKQHLFNQGHANTVKLSCVIDDEPFSNYKWRVKFKEIDNYEIRYAVEAWWRFKFGWPAFCLK